METLKLHIQIAAVKVLPPLKGCFGFMPQFVYKKHEKSCDADRVILYHCFIGLKQKTSFPHLLLESSNFC